jgi:hypothetical protein
MPEQKKNSEINSEEKIREVEALLRLVNDTENKQELRLKEDYYARFHWLGDNAGAFNRGKSYFSYQEEAVYDFVFNLSKSGILSDQVGMGKTIEAGMIISELASRNELRSLLIIVPNEIMAQKWEYELQEKFGIREYQRINADGEEESFPLVKSIRNLDDFARCIFTCISQEYFHDYEESISQKPSDPNCPVPEYSYVHRYEPTANRRETLSDVLKGFIKRDIEATIRMFNKALKEFSVSVAFDGTRFSIGGTKLSRQYEYDKNGLIKQFLNVNQNLRVEIVCNNNNFFYEYRNMLLSELDGLFILIGQYFSALENVLTNVAQSMTTSYPILVIPKEYSVYLKDQVELKQFLNHVLFNEAKNYKHQYNTQNEQGEIVPIYEDYRVIDFFIDVGYQTLIVDEVHDYIDVCKPLSREDYHTQKGFTKYPSSKYNCYELFDDYYFIPKSSLYKKLKMLADKSNRKIFLTATPIKSDMVDFYLLTLLASNKDSEAYSRIANDLHLGSGEYATIEEIENKINEIYNAFKRSARYSAPECFCQYNNYFLEEEDIDAATEVAGNHVARYKYPYFNNKYLRSNINHADKVRDYLLSAVSYMSVEEIIMELVLAYNAEVHANADIKTTFKNLLDLLYLDHKHQNDHLLQTRVIFRAILDNSIKQRFEEDFTTEDGVHIKRISELLNTSDGPRKWHKTYRKYGIRHTRHQTYNLSECPDLAKLNKNKMERFRNLPVWPRRDGKVIYLFREDVFFDSFLNVNRKLKDFSAKPIQIEDLPNIDKMTGTEEEKAIRFKTATNIFNYINDSMSGGDSRTHLPHSSRYTSVNLDDAQMVDYKLAMVNYLMAGSDPNLGSISGKVLLFAENDRDAILEWFRYQQCAPLYQGEKLDPAKLEQYKEMWRNYSIDGQPAGWSVSDDTADLKNCPGNVLIIIDPKRYEKGVDLQKASTMINFDINYCPLKMEQRIGRIDRIRPRGESQQINIISFVPLNNMSGFVINFFANELKMFTQWMGETTGIISVPEEDVRETDGDNSVAFEKQVKTLEKFYLMLYDLCRKDVSDKDIATSVTGFTEYFKTNKLITQQDFEFARKFRKHFDKAFMNSISPAREGFEVEGSDSKVIRFNSRASIAEKCAAAACDHCPSKNDCKGSGGNCRNDSAAFVGAVEKFCSEGLQYYEAELDKHRERIRKQHIVQLSVELQEMSEWTENRIKQFRETKALVASLIQDLKLNRANDKSFTLPIASFNNVFDPIKRLYWDEVVMKYMQYILDQFHSQCDNVLSSAALFEKFIKTLAVADFMNNMEGNQ